MCDPKIQLVVFLHWLRSWLGAPVFLAPHYAKLGLICGFLEPIYPVTVLWYGDVCRVSSLITLNCEKQPSEHINVSSHKSWPPLRKLTHRLHFAVQYLNYFIFWNFYTAASKHWDVERSHSWHNRANKHELFHSWTVMLARYASEAPLPEYFFFLDLIMNPAMKQWQRITEC